MGAPDRPRPLRIALDPEIRSTRGPELTWAWRLLLTTIGRPWTEVPAGSECDVAHLGPGAPESASAAVSIRANRDRWRNPGRQAALGEEIDREEGTLGDRDLVFDAFWLATAQAEREWPRNVHGHPQPEGPLLQRRLFEQAPASGIAARLNGALSERGLGAGVPRWPQGKRAAACLTHDVDYPEAIRWLEPARVLRRRGRPGAKPALEVLTGRRSTWQFASWVRMEERFGARSAFYFVPRKGSLREYATGTPDPFYDVTTPRFRAMFQALGESGAEVGLHASYRAFESEERFATERERLERAAGRPVTGNRHHYLHLHPERPEDTLLLHEKLGLSYDTTLGHDRHLGWRNGLAVPFFPFHQGQRRQLGTLQLPFAWMDQQLLQYGELNPGDPAELLRGLVSTAADQEGCLVVNIHDYTFDPELFPGWSRTYEALVEDVSERGDFWIETPAAVAEHWRARAAAIAEASRGLEA
jgi:hypothetical protein